MKCPLCFKDMVYDGVVNSQPLEFKYTCNSCKLIVIHQEGDE